VLGATGGDLMLAASVVLWSAAILSAFVDNIPFVAAMIPLIKSVGPRLADGTPHGMMVLWWALALGACLGGNGTLIGASANLTVAGLAERQGIPFKFMSYTKVALPLMLMSILIAQAYLYLRFF
jgi:Na+/H+ antiporter NhaD/arsenite permease-like protein